MNKVIENIAMYKHRNPHIQAKNAVKYARERARTVDDQLLQEAYRRVTKETLTGLLRNRGKKFGLKAGVGRPVTPGTEEVVKVLVAEKKRRGAKWTLEDALEFSHAQSMNTRHSNVLRRAFGTLTKSTLRKQVRKLMNGFSWSNMGRNF
jgi:signal-transduction protein with cAMP-binding, CBS, and nucleotidyltransferase domain